MRGAFTCSRSLILYRGVRATDTQQRSIVQLKWICVGCLHCSTHIHRQKKMASRLSTCLLCLHAYGSTKIARAHTAHTPSKYRLFYILPHRCCWLPFVHTTYKKYTRRRRHFANSSGLYCALGCISYFLYWSCFSARSRWKTMSYEHARAHTIAL